ncbi:MAG: cytochrome c biogenesis protein ResB [Prevotella sp.]|nr:cytochrome c biogenesis protein ResB [Prevotella sp.]
MWNKPWRMQEGFVIGGGLICAGLMLELAVGKVMWDAFSWPANLIVLAGFLLLALLFFLQPKSYFSRFLASYHAAVPALVYVVALTIIMGLTRQQANGTWFNDMLSFWPFVLIYTYVALILALVVLNRLSRLLRGKKKWVWRSDVPFFLNHGGILIALVTATLGNADMQRLKMITVVGEPEWRAVDDRGVVQELPIAIQLKKFILEEYPAEMEPQISADSVMMQRTPKRFASDILILTKSGKKISATVDVNQPVSIEGWNIYQYGYDTQMGAMSSISILELVSDPWLPFVYTGIWMMIAGAITMFIFGVRRKRA